MKIIFFAIVKLFFIVFLGFCLYKKRVLSEEVLKFLTFFVVNLSIPSLIFTKIIESFSPATSPQLMSFIFLSISIFLVGALIGIIVSLSVRREIRREFISLVSFQNSGYLPMNIALFLFASNLRDEFLVYIFLYILGFNILMWSLGSFFIFKKEDERFSIQSLFTTPVVTIVISLVLVYTGLRWLIPEAILSPLKIIGETSFPLSMIILGAWLARVRTASFFTELSPIFKVILVKLIVIPFIFSLGIIKLEMSSLFGLFVVLEASMPSAASLPIVANIRRADSEFVSRGVFFTHLVSMVTVPLWVELFLKFSGYTF